MAFPGSSARISVSPTRTIDTPITPKLVKETGQKKHSWKKKKAKRNETARNRRINE